MLGLCVSIGRRKQMNLLLKNEKVSKEQSKFAFSNTVIAEVLKQFSWKKSDSSLIMTDGNNCLVLIRDGLVVRVGISANINPSVEKVVLRTMVFQQCPDSGQQLARYGNESGPVAFRQRLDQA